MKYLKTIILPILLFLLYSSVLYSFTLDKVSSPQLISSGEIYLLSADPSTAFYQPAYKNTGVSLNHSNPYSFTELNVFHLASQFEIKQETISSGAIVLENKYISDKVFYLGYAKTFRQITFGANARFYHFSITDYETLTAFTGNIGVIWEHSIFTHGVSYSNITHSTEQGIDLPSTMKYECQLSPLESTHLAISLEKEKNFDLRYGFGVSHQLYKTLALSTGFISNPSQFSAGLVIKANDIEVSFGTRTHTELGYTQAVGIKYSF